MYITIEQLDILREQRLLTYDTALPQSWFDDVINRTGRNPSGHVVWLYQPEVEGPFPVTQVGVGLLADYYKACAVQDIDINISDHQDSLPWGKLQDVLAKERATVGRLPGDPGPLEETKAAIITKVAKELGVEVEVKPLAKTNPDEVNGVPSASEPPQGQTKLTKIVWTDSDQLEAFFNDSPHPHSPSGFGYHTPTAVLMRALDEVIGSMAAAIEEQQDRKPEE